MDTNEKRSQVINEFALRKLVGFLAVLLPIVLAIGAPVLSDFTGIQNSISEYYYTVMRSYFVGTLCAVAVVLFCYKGYEQQDDIAGDIAAVLALMVAFFPTTPDILPVCEGMCKAEFFGIIHLTAAASLFLVLSYFSLQLFTKSRLSDTELKEDQHKAKRHRNIIYKICGWTMIGCLIILIPFFALDSLTEVRIKYKVVFWLEVAMLWAFGISWLTKGEIIFSDADKA